ncbi:MAG: hypothetical protein H6739_37655 [Alphaproteobacteria bacterium]|nr:hypothetical protein [Alphaproteobacteria bacterium]
MTEEQLVLARQRHVARNLRRSVRGIFFALLVVGVVLSGALPMSATTANVLLVLAGTLGLTRAMRALWAVRVARHLLGGWGRRRIPGRWRPVQALPAPAAPPESADRRAVRALTVNADEPLVERARVQALALVDRMEELRGLLADTDLSAVLRRPLAEALAGTEADLEALLQALSELSDSNEASQRADLLQRLAARLEVDRLATPALLVART